ncbi:putative 1,3-beta-glucanosyltransferase gel1 [Amylocarpus encephaloides]|uniref:1,3-beta-glucanosyltransferase n=1 Tax=Amylocarpus encephaloides TaxID=45428 RepID=A0A9P7YFW0_9HELO|nr:putative 1,3-beta-glucanosyltransferase gel1 [Amylocarpus encephaloides]
MKTFTAMAAFAAAVLATPTPTTPDLVPRASTSLVPITVKGNAFFQGDKRFYMRGVDWQPGGSSDLVDPIADTALCTRDIANFKALGLNTVRIYTVDNTANHDACMELLAAAGIYLVLDVNTPLYSLNRATPAPSYNGAYLQNVFSTMDAFVGYSNTLAFFSGNEVINDDLTTNCAPYVKAVTRDMRSYLASRKYRQVPVGYSAADVDSNRLEMAQYMNCGSDDERSDFFAFNDYSWCDPSSFTTSGWDQKVKNFTGYGLPLFLSEYGCNTNKRQFNEVASLYSTDMTAVYSGGLVYEYSEEGSKYGLVKVTGTKAAPLPDFTALQSALKKTPAPTGDGGYNSTGGASTCPKKSANWVVEGDSLPAIPSGAVKFLTEGPGKGVGLKGLGSQTAGGESTGFADAGSGTAAGGSAAASTSKSAASSLQGPMNLQPVMVSGVMLAFTFMGALLL